MPMNKAQRSALAIRRYLKGQNGDTLFALLGPINTPPAREFLRTLVEFIEKPPSLSKLGVTKE